MRAPEQVFIIQGTKEPEEIELLFSLTLEKGLFKVVKRADQSIRASYTPNDPEKQIIGLIVEP